MLNMSFCAMASASGGRCIVAAAAFEGGGGSGAPIGRSGSQLRI